MKWKVCLLIFLGFLFLGGAVYESQERQKRIRAFNEANAFKPLTDWKKFHDALKKDKPQVAVSIMFETADDKNTDIIIFLVDNDKWYHIGTQYNLSCGGKTSGHRSYVALNSLSRELDEVPSEDAKIVLVGPSKPKLKELKFFYPDDSPNLFK